MYHILYWRPRRVDQDHSAPNILLRYIRTAFILYLPLHLCHHQYYHLFSLVWTALILCFCLRHHNHPPHPSSIITASDFKSTPGFQNVSRECTPEKAGLEYKTYNHVNLLLFFFRKRGTYFRMFDNDSIIRW